MLGCRVIAQLQSGVRHGCGAKDRIGSEGWPIAECNDGVPAEQTG